MDIFRRNTSSHGDGKDLYRESFMKTDAGLCLLTHPDFEIYDLNDSFGEALGFERKDLKGSLFAKVWKKCEERDEFFTAIIRNGRFPPKTTTVTRPDGHEAAVVISGEMIREDMILITVFGR